MPVEEGYSARIMPQAGAAMPLATPETYGAGVFKAAGELGDTIHETRLRAYEVERKLKTDREAADFAHRFALHRQNMDGIVEQLRNNPTGPDYGEHVKLVQDADQAARDGLLSGITEESLRNRALEQLDNYGAQLHDSEFTFAETKRVAKTVTDSVQVKNLGANRIRQGMDPQHYGQEVQAYHDYVGGLQNVPRDVREKLLRDADETYAIAYINHLNDTNPTAAIGLIDAGAFNDVLTPQQIDAARSGAQVEVRRVEAEAQRVQAVGKAQFRESVATVKAQDAQGIDVSAQLPALAQQAQAYGDTSTVVELQGLARNTAFAKVWNVATPIQRQQRLSELQGIPQDKRSADQQAEIKWLQDKSGALDSKFNADPVGFVVQNGKPGEQPPAINPQDPNTFQARARWQAQMQQAYGYMRPLSADEAAGYRQILQQTANGKQAVADVLSQFPPLVARQAARQIAPEDPYLAHVVTLPEQNRHMALQGAIARKGDPTVINAQNPDDKPLFGVAKRQLDTALAAVPFEDRNAVLNAARDIAAYHIRQDGEAMDANTWWRSLNEALGGTPGASNATRKGGISSWNDHPFLVPRNMTAGQFYNGVFDWVKRNPEKGPVNPDGSPAALRNAYPVMVANGTYQFVVGTQRVKGRDGKVWQYQVGQ